MPYPKLEGLIRLSSSTLIGVANGATNITIPAGEYYLTTAGSGARSFLDEFEFQMQSGIGGTSTFTVSDDTDAATGLVTLTHSASFTFTWSSTTLRDALGFSGSLTPSNTSFTGSSHAKYLHLPNTGRSEVMAPESSSTSRFGAIETDYTISVAPSGVTKRLGYTKRYVDVIDFRNLKGFKAWIEHETRPQESLEQFYGDVISQGLPVRYYKSRDTDATYNTFVVENGQDYKPRPVMEMWVGAQSLWSIAFRVRKLV